MLKKSKQKITQTSHFRPLLNKAVLILIISALFLSIFPILAPGQAVAADVTCDLDRAGVDIIRTGPFSDRKVFNWNTEFNIQFSVAFQPSSIEVAKKCQETKQLYPFYVYIKIFDQGWSPALQVNAKFYTEKNAAGEITEYGYAIRQAVTVKQIFPLVNPPYVPYCEQHDINPCTKDADVWIYYGNARSSYYFGDPLSIKFSDKDIQGDPPVALPPLPGGVVGGGPTGTGSNTAVDYTKLGISIAPDGGGKGLRKKYRVLLSDTAMSFGATGGPDAIYMKWRDTDPKLQLKPGDTFLLPKKDNSWLNVDLDPQYNDSTVAFNYADAKATTYQLCRAGYFSTDCAGAYFDPENSSGTNGTAGAYKPLPEQYNPTLKSAAWLRNRTSTAAEGKPVATNEFVAIPQIHGYSAKFGAIPGNGNVYILYGTNVPKFTVEVFANEASLKAACKAEAAEADKTKCDDLAYAKYGFAETITQSTTSTETKDTGGGLYAFILKVISFIVISLITVIYKIFSFVLVPVLNSLIRIHPYKDQFVNVIYPGWLIMRNLANIAFIVALLVMGLRVLFQIDDASKTRSFMIKLVLMALLVNFSLVIAQGIVAIADTVQSQFLPENTKVIEALAVKLMVEPINVFQGATKFADTELAAADIFKPIMLLITSLAAFFAFVAVAGFIAVRTVALWVFYLTSPFAYFGQLLPQTKGAADDWWTQFMKYVVTVPVLVFFLNIAALMATTFAQQTGNAVNVEGDNGYLLGGVAAGVEGFAFTILTQAIVLIFIFIGMKFAMNSGTVGAKQIVGAAKSGFDWATQTAPKALGRGALGAAGWAKDTGADWRARAATERGDHTRASLWRAAARPIEAGKALKKGYFDKPKEIFDKRFAKDFENRANQLQPWGEDKMFPVKMAYWKLTGQNAKAMESQAKRNQEIASIMDDDERDNLKTSLAADAAKVSAMAGGKMSTEDGRGFVRQMTDKYDEKAKEIKDLETKKTAADTSGDTLESGRLAKEIVDKQKEQADIGDKRKNVSDEISKAEAAGAAEFDFKGVSDDLKAVVDVDDLEKGMKDALSEKDSQIRADQALRDKYGITTMNEDVRKGYDEQAQKDMALAQKRQRPASKALEKEDAAEVLKEKKEIVDMDLDYDQLKQGAMEALAKNNTNQAKAYFKVMAENGMMKKFMESHKDDAGKNKYDYNVQGLEKFIKEHVKGTQKNQISVIREISKASEKNGGLPLGFAVKNLAGGGGMLKSYQTQMKEVAKEMQKKSIKDFKEGDISHINPDTGKEVTTAGVKEWIKSYDTFEKAKQIKRDMNPKIAKQMLDSMSASEKSSMTEVAAALKERAEKGSKL